MGKSSLTFGGRGILQDWTSTGFSGGGRLETTNITRNGHGYQIADALGNVIGNFRDWSQVAEVFRGQDFSEEYIAKRKADLDQNATTTVDETND